MVRAALATVAVAHEGRRQAAAVAGDARVLPEKGCTLRRFSLARRLRFFAMKLPLGAKYLGDGHLRLDFLPPQVRLGGTHELRWKQSSAAASSKASKAQKIRTLSLLRAQCVRACVRKKPVLLLLEYP